MKKIGDLTVNDDNGLSDNEGLCDSLIMDLNGLVKALVSGQYIQFSGTITTMTKKLANLKAGIRADLESKDKIIEELKRANNALVKQKTGLPVEKDGAGNGND